MADTPDDNQNGSGLNLEQKEINVDELTIKILIVVKNPSRFENTGSFLTRRGWPTTVLGNVNKAIQFIVKDKPDFVLISFNHPNPNIIRLPTLLAQSFNISTVAFCELGDAITMAKLNRAPVKYKITTQPSGPNIQRGLRKILLEQYGLAGPTADKSGTDSSEGHHHNADGTSSSAQKSSDIVHLHSSSSEGEGPKAQSSRVASFSVSPKLDKNSHSASSSDEAQKLLQMLAANDESNLALEDESDIDSSSGGAWEAGDASGDPEEREGFKSGFETAAGNGFEQGQESSSAKQGSLAYMPNQDEDDGTGRSFGSEEPSSSPTLGARAGKESSGIYIPTPEEQARNPNNFNNAEGRGQDQAGINQQSESFKATGPYATQKELPEEMSANQEGVRDKEGNRLQSASELELAKRKEAVQSGAQGPELAARQEGEASDPSRIPLAQSKKQGQVATAAPLAHREELYASRELNVAETILQKVVREAFNDVCSKPGGRIRHLIETQSLGVIPVNLADQSGYIIIGKGGGTDQKIDDKFLGNLVQSLAHYAGNHRLSSKFEKAFTVKTDRVYFCDWARNESAFFMLRESGDHEMGVAFISTGGKAPQVKPSQKKEMPTISVKDISTDKPVNFKAYLHMKKNGKYFLYLNDGRILLPQQKERLEKNNVADFHINDKDVENYKMYMASNYLNGLINNFKGGKNSA